MLRHVQLLSPIARWPRGWVAAMTLLVVFMGVGGAGAARAEALPKATAISTGSGHACALLSNATVKCWGHNGEGQLGDGTRARRLTAVAVHGLAGATSVSADSSMSCALLADGTARCWGANHAGQLGDGTTTSRSAPVAVLGLTGAVAISAGGSGACALLADHTVACWGDNALGELGNGTRVRSPTPVAVPGLNDVTAVNTGNRHACALHSNGTVSCWGWSGHPGDVDTDDRLRPTLVPRVTDAVSVSANPYRSCVVTTRGVPECWTGFSRPTVVRGFANVKAFSSSLDGQQTDHNCAVIAGGTVKCQSPYPYMGQVGIGRTLTKRVVTVAGLHGATAISTNSFYTCAVLTSGAVKCWGSNEGGQLGDGTTLTRFRPVSVRGIDKPATGRATLDVFAGRWFGHVRSLRITAKGRATMDVNIGCCTDVINLSFRLSRVRGTYSSARARARVTRVHVFEKSLVGRAGGPRVGQVGTVRLKRGVITESFQGWNFCGESAQPGTCGA